MSPSRVRVRNRQTVSRNRRASLERSQCSWHYHNLKDEVFFLQSGRLRVRFGTGDDLAEADSVVPLPGMAFAVAPGLRHQMEAEEDSDLFELSTHHEEHD